MELLLLKDVENLGKKGDVVRVRDGYGRNFLVARDLALPATRANQEFFAEQKTRSEERKAKERQAALTQAEAIGARSVQIPVRAGEDDKLFGSVTSEQIAEAVSSDSFACTKKQVKLKEPLKTLGAHKVEIEVYPQVKAQVTVELVREEN